jgi:hypothetical protein
MREEKLLDDITRRQKLRDEIVKLSQMVGHGVAEYLQCMLDSGVVVAVAAAESRRLARWRLASWLAALCCVLVCSRASRVSWAPIRVRGALIASSLGTAA